MRIFRAHGDLNIELGIANDFVAGRMARMDFMALAY